MKRLLIALGILALNGCVAYDAYTLTTFDSNEYQLMAQIRVDARHFAQGCSNPIMSQPNAVAIANETELFVAYSEYLPHNADAVKAAIALNEIAQGLKNRYNEGSAVSPLFCKLKFNGIEHSADLIQRTLGNRPR
jgi:hypothetical protein